MISHDDAALQQWVQTCVGLNLRDGDTVHLRPWLAQQMQRLGLSHLQAYSELLQCQDAAAQHERALLHARLTTGETYFWRDPAQIEVVAAQLLPELVQRRQGQRRLRIWSAGCATGEEAYTLAMLVHEMPLDWAGWDISILATDINADALSAARLGQYGEWSFRTLDAARRQRYFEAQGTALWTVRPDLRALVHFAPMDLLHGALPDTYGIGLGFDLIVCRNVFIYMAPHAVAQVSQRLCQNMALGGYLVCGHGELLGQNLHGLHTRVFPHTLAWHKAATSAADERAPRVAEHLTLATSAAPAPRPQSQPQSTAQQPATPHPAGSARAPANAAQPGTTDTAQALLEQAWAHANAGRPAQALQVCAQLEQHAPLDARPLYLRAQLAQECGELDEALRLLEQVMYLEPDTVAAYVESAALYRQLGQATRAQQRLAAACRLLQRMAPSTLVAPYESTTAADLLAYLSAQADAAPTPPNPAHA